MAGMTHCQFAKGGNHLITVSEFKVRLTVWSLADKSVQYIKSPKFDDGRGIVFSLNNKMAAIAEKSSERDSIGIYDTTKNTWQCMYHFTPDTYDIENIQFSGDG